MKKWLRAIIFSALLLVLFVSFIPQIVEVVVLPPVLAKAGIANYKISISRLGLNGCTLHVSGKSDLAAPVVAGDIRIDWTPSGLLNRRVDKVSSNGLQVNLVNLPNIEKKAIVPTEKKKETSPHGHMPLVVDQVVVNNGVFLLQHGNQIKGLPFSFSGQRIDISEPVGPSGVISFRVRLLAAQNKIDATISFDSLQNKISSALRGNLDLALLSSIIPVSVFQEIKGSVQFNSDAIVKLGPFSLEHIESSFAFEDFLIVGHKFKVRTQEKRSVTISLSGAGSQFQVKMSDLFISEPFVTALDFDTHFVSAKDGLDWQGNLVMKPESGVLLFEKVLLKEVAPIYFSHVGSIKNGKVQVHFENETMNDRTEGQSFVVQKDDVTTAIEKLGVDTRLVYETKSESKTLSGTLLMKGANGMVETPKAIISFPELVLKSEGVFFLDGENGQTFTTLVKVNNASMDVKKQNLNVEGVNIELPLAWPLREDSRKGKVELNTIRKDGNDLGSFTGEVVQSAEHLQIDGDMHTLLLPEDKISLSGKVLLPKKNEATAELTFSLQNGHVDVDNLSTVFPALQDISGTGNVEASGNLVISPCGLTGSADFSCRTGRLSLNGTQTEIDDVSLDLRFPDLSFVFSSPRQHLSIGEIRKKEMVVNDVNVWFEIESPQSLFVEKISGRWSKGRVFSSSFRLQKGQEELDVAILCDRLELSSILSQFGLAEAGGEGRLSGRVPLIYSSGKFFVDDGFLYSTPGEKGYLKIKKSNYLETTIPANVPQFSPLHFAGAALADFEYNWAKLQIDSVDENLQLKLQVDGKPREKLPFRFDSGSNMFVRLEDESKGGIDQPIRLDVNFNVPLNEMFQYKDKLMPLFR